MTQTKSVHLLSTSQLLQTIDPQLIADDDLRMSVETLLNLRSELNQKVKKLERENQLLKDENNRLKGEQGKPDIKSKKKGDKNKNYSSEKERKISQNKSKSRKNQNIKIDREEILDYDEDQLPKDAIFKGYEEVKVSEFMSNIGISISTGQISNILIKNQDGKML
jgi:regulator of replication initiation timing